MIEPSAETRVYPLRRWRLAWLMVFCLLATLVAALVIVAAGAFPPQQAWLAGIGGGLALLVFGAATISAASRLFGRQPGLVLDHEGILDNTSFSSVGRVPWTEITGVRVVHPPGFRNRPFGPTIRPPRFVIVDVRDPRPFLRRGNLLKRWLIRANAWGLGSPVAIAPSSVDVDTDKLIDYIRRIAGPA
jgi:hypothetical protein